MALKILLATGLLVTSSVSCGSRDSSADGSPARTASTLPTGVAAPVVLFLGTSLTAGRGLDVSQAYPALIQQKIDSAGLSFRVVNAGENGGTSAGGVRRIEWRLHQPVAVLLLELGANDGLRGQDLEALRANLQEIIDRTRAAHPEVAIVLAGMEAPPNLGARYTDQFRRVFVDVARDNQAELIPFLLEGVAGVAELNQADGIHPTAGGQRAIAENVWRVLQSVLQTLSPSPSFERSP